MQQALEHGAAIVRLRLRGIAWHRIGFALGINSRTAQLLRVNTCCTWPPATTSTRC